MSNEGENEMNEQYGKTRLQVRTKFGHRTLHIQGIGPIQVNRDYGMAMDLRAPDEIVEWLTEQQPKQRSAASKEDLYIELIVRKYPGEGEKEVYQF